MCDYSLMSLPNRLAVAGEELMVHRFELGSMGLASVADVCRSRQIPQVRERGFWAHLKRFLFPPVMESCPAVCVPPGARLLVRDIPERVQKELKLSEPIQEVVFTQLATIGFRDAIRFTNGNELLLQRLTEGQRVRVLALSSEESELEPMPDFESVAPSGSAV